ncbi:hypothetical protein MLD38_038257 [Melastoma candidum]|uniref:Uncharacterized protein n=1 Tax=Melastoma candidum TaxID=119954 RepID=A0ACB9KYZ3_9MYRT|nr:hypothetical protein MLD38_038257 [Melastoma candidum]
MSSSLHASPKSIEKHCHPNDHVVMETEVKGILVKSWIKTPCLRMEEEQDEEKRREGMSDGNIKAARKKGGGL